METTSFKFPYEVLDRRNTSAGVVTIAKSVVLPDRQWDDFLNGVEGVEFEQTSLWAMVKQQNGWQSVRIIFIVDDCIVGGYQVLTKKVRFIGVLGYAIKGPTCSRDDQAIISCVTDTLLSGTGLSDVKALIVQPPFISPGVDSIFTEKKVLYERMLSIIRASVVIPLAGKNVDDIYNQIKRQKRQNISKAVKNELKFVEGCSTDIDLFFDLMVNSCRRNNLLPNPQRSSFFKEMWKIFSKRHFIRLFFVEKDGKKICGVLAILFGKSVYMWKFGWSGEYAEYRPNDFIFWKIIEWSKLNGYSFTDFMGTNLASIPEEYKSCSIVPDDKIVSHGSFKHGFGGSIHIFPEVRIVFYSNFIRIIYFLGNTVLHMLPGFIQKNIKSKIGR